MNQLTIPSKTTTYTIPDGEGSREITLQMGDETQYKVILLDEIDKSCRGTHYKKPDDKTLGEMVSAYFETLQVPIEDLRASFALARHHTPTPTATGVNKAFEKGLLPKIARSQKLTRLNQSRKADYIHSVVNEIGKALVDIPLGLDGLTLMSAKRAEITSSAEFKTKLMHSVTESQRAGHMLTEMSIEEFQKLPTPKEWVKKFLK